MAETEASDLVEATGLAIALIGSLLEGRGLLPKGEFDVTPVSHPAITRVLG